MGGITNSEWLGLAPQWVDLDPKCVGICPPRATHGCAPAQSCEIHRLVPNEFISVDGFPYMNCNSVKLLKLLHVSLIFLFSIICVIRFNHIIKMCGFNITLYCLVAYPLCNFTLAGVTLILCYPCVN